MNGKKKCVVQFFNFLKERIKQGKDRQRAEKKIMEQIRKEKERKEKEDKKLEKIKIRVNNRKSAKLNKK